MDEQIARTIRRTKTLAEIAQLERNLVKRNYLTDENGRAIHERKRELARALIAQKTGLVLDDLSPAEERIVNAVSEFVVIRTNEGRTFERTMLQLRNAGLIGAAEKAVMAKRPTEGFMTIVDANREDLSYERIIVEHAEEFSGRALWYARRTLGLGNSSDRPPAATEESTQSGTEELLRWLEKRAATNGGHLPPHENAEAADAIGLSSMRRDGRLMGNIQSRIDFACYKLGLPPLGLAARQRFSKSWAQAKRSWKYPVEEMQVAARARIWTRDDFTRLIDVTRELPASAHVAWATEMESNEAGVRSWAEGVQGDSIQPATSQVDNEPVRRNAPWSRDELILALDLYLRFRGSPPSKISKEVAELSQLLAAMARAIGVTAVDTYRNANGVYMKMMNFRRFDSEYTFGGKVGLTRGNQLEEVVWNEFVNDPLRLADEVDRIRAAVEKGDSDKEEGDPAQRRRGMTRLPDDGYWVFVCNPKKWAIDRFLRSGIERDYWGVRPSDRKRFAPGQLGIIRVGVDQRSRAELQGVQRLEAGIYALCEVESEVFPGTGASDEFWADGSAREPGWPTVRIRYLRDYLRKPLTIERLKAEAPDLSPLLLNGHQAASFPISAGDFRRVLTLLGEDPDELPAPTEQARLEWDQVAGLESKYLRATPEVRQRVSKSIERGPIGAAVKHAVGYKCQVCEALGQNPFSFRKRNGTPYVEAHHVMPVSKLQVGSLAASNIMTVCANHHRQIHYGAVEVMIAENSFDLTIDGSRISIARHGISADSGAVAPAGASAEAAE